MTQAKLVDEKCVELAKHFLSDIEHATAADQKELAEAIQAACEDACSDIEDRIAADCTCRMSSVNSASIDPPHEIVDPWCPLHGGRDPDRERDERIDREMCGD
jgi:hypothetical protein